MKIDRADETTMTADAFFVWAQTWGDGERYELVEGHPVRLQSERVSHAETKLSVVVALRDALRKAKLPCVAFPDGVSVRVSELSVREPDAIVHCGPYEPDEVYSTNPVVVVEAISPSSVRTDVDRKLIDYFSVPSILHYLIVYGSEKRVVHHRRKVADGEIVTAILGEGAVIDLSPPGFSVTVEALLMS